VNDSKHFLTKLDKTMKLRFTARSLKSVNLQSVDIFSANKLAMLFSVDISLLIIAAKFYY
jgi:hypothetical protein